MLPHPRVTKRAKLRPAPVGAPQEPAGRDAEFGLGLVPGPPKSTKNDGPHTQSFGRRVHHFGCFMAVPLCRICQQKPL